MLNADLWRRADGVQVTWNQSTPHSNPANPRARMWTTHDRTGDGFLLMKEVGRERHAPSGKTYRLRVPLRFATAEAAMRAVDREHPLARD